MAQRPRPVDIRDPTGRTQKILGPDQYRSLNRRIKFDESAWNNDFNIKKVSVLYREVGMNLTYKAPRWVATESGTDDGITVDACYASYEHLSTRERTKNEWIVRNVAKQVFQLPWACIRFHQHNTLRCGLTSQYVKTVERSAPVFLPADWHITVYIGMGREHICVEGHIHVKVEKFKPGKPQVPLGLLPPGTRAYLSEREQKNGLTKASAYILDVYGCGGAAGFEGWPDLPAWAESEGVSAQQSTDTRSKVNALAKDLSRLQVNQI